MSLRALVTVAILCSFASNADAFAQRVGNTLVAVLGATRGTSVAFDSTNKVYLVVSTMGLLRGRFVAADGTPQGVAFIIQENPLIYTHFPRVTFSPDADNGAGAFLVTWHASDQPVGTSVHSRLVSFTRGGAFGPDNPIGVGSFWEAGPVTAYASVSKEFLVAWKGFSTNQVAAVRLNINGQVIAPVALTPTPEPFDGERDPSVAYNPTTNEYLLVNAGWSGLGAIVEARRVAAGTGTVGPRVLLVATGGTYITDVEYNPDTNQFLASWYSTPAAASLGRLINANGTIASDIIPLSTRWKAYDALSVAFNKLSHTFFLVSHSHNQEDGGVELGGNGIPVDNGFLVTAAGGNGNFYPRVAASTAQPDWLLVTANNFTSAMIQRVSGTPGGGTPPPPPPPDPTPPASNPLMTVDVPRTGASVAGTVTVAGWAIDRGATANTGVNTVHVWAYPSTGAAATFLGAATMGTARTDVGGIFGSNFTNSGYVLSAPLAPGTYNLVVYAFSTIAKSFNNWVLVPITVTPPVSVPRMAVDLPTMSQTVTTTFTVAGWAIDLGSSSGTGIDAVHAWAYPVAGGAPVFAGAATLGHNRPDVGTAFSATRFAGGGFKIDGSLPISVPRGEYNLVVFAHSALANAWNNVVVIRIRVV